MADHWEASIQMTILSILTDLLRFANIVYEKTKGEIFCLFDDTVKSDIEIFMHHFKKMVSCLD